MSRICLIFNPTARGDKARRLAGLLREFSTKAELRPTLAAGSARRQASEAVREGFEIVVAAGGDGTVNEVLNGIADEPDGLEKTRLGVLPMGTVNVLAAELNIPFRPAEAWQVVLEQKERKMDLGQARFESEGKQIGRVFLQMAGAGLDARAVELVDWEWKKKVGQIAYIMAGFKALRGPQSSILVRHDHGEARGELVLVGNGRFYGGRFPFFHQAHTGDGLLDVCVFRKVSWGLLPRYGWAFLTGQLFRPGETEYVQTRELELTSSTRSPLQLEGEAVGQLPARLSVMAQGVRVIVPS